MDCSVTVVDCLGDFGPGAFCTQAQYMRGVGGCAVLTDISPISAAVEISISDRVELDRRLTASACTQTSVPCRV